MFPPQGTPLLFSSAYRLGIGKCPQSILVCIMPERKSFFCRTGANAYFVAAGILKLLPGQDASERIVLNKPDKRPQAPKKEPRQSRGFPVWEMPCGRKFRVRASWAVCYCRPLCLQAEI